MVWHKFELTRSVIHSVTKTAAATPHMIVRLPNWVGDVCMSLPALDALAQTGHRLVICARPWARPIMQNYKPVEFVTLSGKFLDDLKAIRALPPAVRRGGLGLILPDSLSSAALFFLSGIKSVGYRDDGRGMLLRWPSPKPGQSGQSGQPGQPDQPVHATEKWWLLTKFALNQWEISAQALPNTPPPAHLALTPEDLEPAAQILAQHNLDPGRVVLLAPTATGLHRGQIKVWPHFGALATQLKTAGYQPITCPPAHEREQAQSACPDALMLAPLPIRSFCGLARQVALVVCNDSGVSHLAACVKATQLTLFGVTNPANTRPWSETAGVLGQEGQWPSLDQVTAQVFNQLSAPKAARLDLD